MRNARKPRRAACAAGAVGLMLLYAPVTLAAPPTVGPTALDPTAAAAALGDALGGGPGSSPGVPPIGQTSVDPVRAVAASAPLAVLPTGLATQLGVVGLLPRYPILGVLQQALAQAGFPAGAPFPPALSLAQGLGQFPPLAAVRTTTDPLDATAGQVAIGSTGPAVVALENTLTDWGFASAVQGPFTEATAALVAEASARAGARSGDLSARLGLIGFGPRAPLLLPGGRGPQVAALQRALTRAGYPLGATGRFGPDTEAQVLAFQMANGLESSGRVTLWQVERAVVEDSAQARALAAAVAAMAERTADLVASARRLVGDRYAWGGAGPWAFDCSGLVRYVFHHAAGIWLPHNSYIQWLHGRFVPAWQLQPGDLVFFDTHGPGPSHVGVYIGGVGREFVNAANPTRGVSIDSLEDAYWARHFVGGRRIL